MLATLPDTLWRGALPLPALSGRPVRIANQHPAFTICDIRWRIRERMEERSGERWPGGLDDGLGPKPKWMHWRTYNRLEARDAHLAGRWRLGVGGMLMRAR